jgi:DNA-binding XRE family transcriptional regulator
MAEVDRWTGRETRLLRHALRLTVRDFAEDLGVSPRTVSKWEAGGADHEPRPELQRALDTLLGRATGAEQVRLREALSGTISGSPHTGGLPQTPAVSSPVSGMAAPGTFTGLPVASADQLRTIGQLVAEARGRAEVELVGFFAARIEACQVRDGSYGPVEALPSTLSVIAAIDLAAREVARVTRRDLLTLAARGAEFAGWLYRDAGALDQATYWYDRAAEWAQEAHDLVMQGYILLRRSQMAYDSRDPVRVLSLAEAADGGPWQLPTCVRAEVVQQQALGLGMLGATAAEVELKLGHAWGLLAQDSPDEHARRLGAVLTAHTLTLRAAVCYTESGQGKRAADLFEQVLATGRLSHRDTGYFTARRAAALARAAEPDTAAALALESAEIATGARSQRTHRVIAEVADTLQPWSDRPTVRDLHELVLRQRLSLQVRP